MKEKRRDIAEKWTQQGLQESDPDRKLHFLNLALEVNPYNIVALNQKGMLLHRSCDYEGAIKCYDKILVQPDTGKTRSALYNKSLALKALGKYEAALNFMNKVIRQDPENERAKKQKASIFALMSKGRQMDEADRANIPPEKLAVNIVYTEWNPPSVSNLLAHALKCSRSDINFHKGLGEDIIKEKAIQDKLSKKIYSCSSCQFQENKVCNYTKTKGMAVSETAICKHFKPIKGI